MGIVKTNTKDIKQHHIFGLIVGPSGSGKTYAIGTLPEENTVILSMESGLLTLAHKSFEVWNITNMDDLKEAYLELRNSKKIQNVALDSLTELSEILFADLRPKYSKSQNFGLYEEYSRQMISIVKSFRDLIQLNTFFTCLTKETERGLTLDVAQKSLGTRLPQYFDLVAYVQQFEKDEKINRALMFESSDLEFCKSRSSSIEQFEKVDLTALINKTLKGE